MAVKVEHRAIPSQIFGTIYRPVVKAEFKIVGVQDWLEVPMIVDTGADYTILPRWLANDLRVDLHRDCERHSTFGIGGTEIVYLARRMLVQLGRWRGNVPVGFLNRDNVPALLGRQEFSDRFRLIFENHTTTFVTPRAGKRRAN